MRLIQPALVLLAISVLAGVNEAYTGSVGIVDNYGNVCIFGIVGTGVVRTIPAAPAVSAMLAISAMSAL